MLAATVVLFPASSGPAYEGALPLIALVSGGLLIGLQIDGPVRTWLAAGPLVWLGRISYGVYLFHWPVYVLLDADRTGLDGAPLLGVRLAVTMAVSVASYQAIELRVRHAQRLRPTTAFIGSALATATVFVAAMVLVPTGLGEYWETDDAIVSAAAIEVDDRALAPLAPTATADRVRPAGGHDRAGGQLDGRPWRAGPASTPTRPPRHPSRRLRRSRSPRCRRRCHRFLP